MMEDQSLGGGVFLLALRSDDMIQVLVVAFVGLALLLNEQIT